MHQQQLKNHFYEMKGDVGLSLHEKERNKNMPIYTKTQVTHNPIPTSLFCFDMLFVCFGSALARIARGVGSNLTGRADFTFFLSFLPFFLSF